MKKTKGVKNAAKTVRTALLATLVAVMVFAVAIGALSSENSVQQFFAMQIFMLAFGASIITPSIIEAVAKHGEGGTGDYAK